MPEQLQKKYSIDINQKLYEKETPQGKLAVYHSFPHGTLLTLNNDIILAESDSVFFHEMMSHPALFTHPQPQKVLITGIYHGILREVLKHPTVSEVWCVTENADFDAIIARFFSQFMQEKVDARVKIHHHHPLNYITTCEPETFDLIIQGDQSEDCLQEHYQHYHRAMRADGILVQPCLSSITQVKSLKLILKNMQQAGLEDCQTLHFPQPSYPAGSRTVMMATKCPSVKRIREKDIYNRNFSTHYYNFDTHKAALALPEFVREELVGQEI